MEVCGETLAEGHREQLGEVFHGGVHCGGGDREKEQAEDLQKCQGKP